MVKQLLAACPAISATLAALPNLCHTPPGELSHEEWGLLSSLLLLILVVTVGENTMISNFKANVRDDLNSCWETITTQMPIQILLAVYLDPRVKDFAFIRDAEKHAAARDNDHMAKITLLYGSALAERTTSMVPGVGA